MNKIQFLNVLPHVFQALATEEQGETRNNIVRENPCHSVASSIWLQDVIFERGHHYLIEAESGKGKSTFCSYIQGYRHDFSGQLLFDDIDTRKLKTSDWVRIRQNNISLLFQELRLFPELTAMENVEIKNRLTGFKTRSQIEQWFEMLGIADKQDAKVGFMSFGQQQRVAMMRALVQPFDFILTDEPISHLDDANATVMSQIMMDEARSQGAAVIITSIGKHMQLSYDRHLML